MYQSIVIVSQFMIQWGFEIQTSLDFEWSKRGCVANGQDFEWDREIRKPNHLKSG